MHLLYELITTQIDDSDHHSSLKILDAFDITEGQFYANADLFPEKFFDLKGKPLRFTTFFYPPYIVWSEVVSTVYEYFWLKNQ